MSLNLPTLQALQALLARVEGGGEEDRALDAEIALHLGEAFCMRRWYSDVVWQFRWQADCEWEPLPHFTTSLDAAVALVERVRPGNVLEVEGFAGSAQWGAMVAEHGATAPTPARALIAALLRAEIAKAQEPQP
jgi:hypothetical protein